MLLFNHSDNGINISTQFDFEFVLYRAGIKKIIFRTSK